MKKRLLYLDVCRFWAVFLVIIYHIDVHMTNYNITSIRSFTIHNNYFTGVTLFIIISGLSLTMGLKNKKVNWLSFYKKRILSVLPLLYIAYTIQYFRLFILYKSSPLTGEKWRIIFTLMGLDGYLSNLTPTFYLGIGEWFIGMILLFYIVFPFFYYLLKEKKIFFIIITFSIYISTIFIPNPYLGFPTMFSLIPTFSLGMFLGYYEFEIKFRLFLVLLTLFIIFQFFYIPAIGMSSRTISDLIVSTTGILCTKYLCKFISFSPVEKIFKQISQMSYGMTLVNQQVIIYFVTIFSNNFLNNTDMLSLYLLIFITIYLISLILNFIQIRIFNYFKF